MISHVLHYLLIKNICIKIKYFFRRKKRIMKQFFQFEKYGTDYRTETIAGLTTFFTMAYIIFVNPAILSASGMPPTAVFVATIIASIVGTLMMALYANVPYAQAPGMGLNALFAYTVVLTLGFTWQQALAMVLICGIVGMIITATGLRKMLIQALPSVIKSAIGGGIGLFIAYIGVKNAGLIQFGATTEGVTSGADAVPSIVSFDNPAVLMAAFGVLLILVLMALKVKGAILIGIVATALVSLLVIAMGADASYFFPGMEQGSGIRDVLAGISLHPGQVVSDIGSVSETAFRLDFSGLFTPDRIFLSIAAIMAFVLTDIFDTVGTLIGTGKRTGIFNEEEMGDKGLSSRLDKALFADLTATTLGALIGTSNVTTYVESSAGIAEGGRTGFASVITAIMFVLCLPLVSVIGIIPGVATAPALIVVGILMMAAVSDIDWSDFPTAAVAFLTMAFMPFAYSITTGIAVGFIVYALIKLIQGKMKELHPVFLIFTALFILDFIFKALIPH
jgi:AGZA family xanthine/uracil permease-like MFS transporter